MLLVTGGWTGGQDLDSTEILTEGASQWIYSGPLPSPRRELRAATIGNRLLVTGEILFLLLYLSVPQCKIVMFLGGYNQYNGNDIYFDDILNWDPIERVWEKFGSLKNERKSHGISVIAWNDVNYLCT